MNFNVMKATHIKGYQIEITFQDGGRGIVDLFEYVGKGEVYQNFQDLEYFKNFRVEFGTLTWGNGETDIAPETLYSKATGKVITLDEEFELHGTKS
jgi:hypothetical protein